MFSDTRCFDISMSATIFAGVTYYNTYHRHSTYQLLEYYKIDLRIYPANDKPILHYFPQLQKMLSGSPLIMYNNLANFSLN